MEQIQTQTSKEMHFPILYTESKIGKKQIWSIKVKNEGDYSEITTEFGYVDGKITINRRKIIKGKNIGKSNETTHYQQAINESKSKWNLKKDKLYTETSATENQPKEKKIPDIFLPMLAMDYNKQAKDIKFPCYVQPKIDGARAIYKDGIFYSRTGKPFPDIPHLSKELSDLDCNIVLDGELYSYNLSFQELIGAIKNNNSQKKGLVYIVYDLINLVLPYKERWDILKKELSNSQFIKLILTEKAESNEDIYKSHAKYVKDGYEGVMIRNIDGLYKLKHRSKNLQKLKEFEENEYPIVDSVSGVGKEKDMVIWTVENSDKKRFSVRPIGTYEDRLILYKNRDKYIGCLLTVRHFGLSDTGIPRFPIGIIIRDYE